MSAVSANSALRAIEAGREDASARGAKVSLAVVDAGGHLVAFVRMDGAEIAGPTLAVDKAYTAVANSTSTHELATLAGPGGELYGLQANGNGRYVIFGGGIPLRDGDEIIGAVGVSGSAVATDIAIATAAQRAFEDSLQLPLKA
jgi:uncharacterized protein GlcG (DUF336 family)